MLEAKLRRELELERVQNGARGPMALAVLRKLNVCRGGFTYEAALYIACLGDAPSPPKFLRRWRFIEKLYQQEHLGNFLLALKVLENGGLIRIENERYSIVQDVIDAIGEDESAYQRHTTYYLAVALRYDQKQDYVGLDIESANLEIAFERTVDARDLPMSFALVQICFRFQANRLRYKQRMDWLTRVGELVAQSDGKFQTDFAIMFGLASQAHPVGNPVENLQHAISAYERTLEDFTPETGPRDYSEIQNSLGIVYGVMAAFEDRELNLRRSKTAYEEALRFKAQETNSRSYATTWHNLGLTFYKLAGIEDRGENLRRAIDAYEEALRFRTAEGTPLSYAKTQADLSVAHYELAGIEDQSVNLRRAMLTSQQALRFATSETAPQEYVNIQLNLGDIYKMRGDSEAAIKCWCEAEKCYRQMGAIEDAKKMVNLVATAGGACE